MPEELVGTYNPTYYDRRAGQYRGANGKFVSRQVVSKLVDREIVATEARLKAHTRLLVDQKIHLAEWQIRMAETIKDSHLRMGMLASGGKDGLTQKHYGAVGYQLKNQYGYLDKFARDLHSGKLTPKSAIARSAMYAESVKVTFSRSEQITRMDNGVNAGKRIAGKRILDAGATHCDECISYERKQWTAIADIVPVGMNCSCHHHCRCRIVWATVPASVLNSAGVLAG